MRIVAAYRARHPAWATVLAFLLGPEFGYFYLGFGRRGTLFLILSLVVSAFILLPAISGSSSAGVTVTLACAFLLYRILGAVLAQRKASRAPRRERYPWFAHTYVWLLLFVVAPTVASQMVRTFVFQPFSIVSGSMAPTLMKGDYVFADKWPFGIGRHSLPFGSGPSKPIGGRLPQRGEVVVFRMSVGSGSGTDYVKRVIGLPGDRVEMRDGNLILNGVAVEKRKVADPTVQLAGAGAQYVESLDGRSYLVLDTSDHAAGDNTEPVTVPEGHYFLLGDNRDNSLDSRFVDVGFIPAESIYARPSIVVFNHQIPERLWETVK